MDIFNEQNCQENMLDTSQMLFEVVTSLWTQLVALGHVITSCGIKLRPVSGFVSAGYVIILVCKLYV